MRVTVRVGCNRCATRYDGYETPDTPANLSVNRIPLVPSLVEVPDDDETTSRPRRGQR